jgi:putative addiction module component (TIGR02574 family)
MTTIATADAIIEAALQLSEEQRAIVVGRLLDSLATEAPPIDEAWASELERRSEGFRNDLESGIAWSQLRDKQ